MTARESAIETALRKTDSRQRRFRLWQHSATLGGVISVLFFLLGLGLRHGAIDTPGLAHASTALIVASGICAWILLALIVMGHNAERSWLANALERSCPALMDRLHTLVFLEKNRHLATSALFYPRIAAQTQQLLLAHGATGKVPSRRAWMHLIAFLLLAGGTVWFYVQFSPWQEMMVRSQRPKPAPLQKVVQKETPLATPTPTGNVIEEKLVWGEVRITEPARDLKVTKTDVVPLQIEAASSEPLQEVAYLNMINGAEEQRHAFPRPIEPRYGVFREDLVLDELQLSDWDVVTYYARAATGPEHHFASEVYFLEVRPFHEDILKLPGGDKGQAYQYLSELSGLIERQQEVVRETHQHAENPPAPAQEAAEDRQKLAETERELSAAVRHLQAQMSMENIPVTPSLDELRKAQQDLRAASGALTTNAIAPAQKIERQALADLVAARKMFQQAISEHPEQFNATKVDKNNPAPTPEQREAMREPQKLEDQMTRRNEDQELSSVYKLKQSLDEQCRTLGQCQNSPGSFSPSAIQQSVAQSRQTLRELKNAAERSPTQENFGQPLREALNEAGMKSALEPLDQLEQAQDEATRGEAAGAAQQALQKISRAFEESQPKELQAARQKDALKSTESLERGLAQLESLTRQVGADKKLGREEQSKQGREALWNLQNGFTESFGSNERGQKILQELDEQLKPGETQFDPAEVRRLADQLRRFSVEHAKQGAKREKREQISNVDPARLPPAYRGRIEKYFQKLSEQ